MAIFDNVSDIYDDWYKTKIGKHADFVESECAFNLFKIKKGMKVLDIGCGTGNFSVKLAKKGCKVTSIDLSDKMLNLAREKSAKENLFINYYHMNVYDLKFPDQHFDAVFSMATFEFVIDMEKAITEIFRVCKDKGQILIGTINRDSKWGELYTSKEFQKNTVFKDAQLRIPEDFKKLKSDKIISTKECLYIPPDIKEGEISMTKEEELSKTERPGYFCVLWIK
ncbi:MAG: class I SAM-dependent methyltransferase [Candidatus Caldatribacteriota bacterium]|nr:class I SAM-dependent methyltransferase [Candidatus Caldatribacteriota bacterium]